MEIFVDGSYNKNTGYYGWAYVCKDYDCIMHEDSGKSNVASSIWNVAGELSATMNAIKYAYKNSIPDITICYDYQGIEEWAEGRWKTKNMYTKQYAEFVNKYRNLGLKIKFCKIKGHSGNFYNDRADELARKASGTW